MGKNLIRARQIADAQISDNHIASGAAIASSKLADGGNWIKKDGSVAFTGNQSIGGNKLTNVGTATVSTDGVNLGQMQSAIAALNSLFDSKPSAKAATTGNITISNPGTDTFDGVTLSSGDILFVRAQTAQAENGLYTFNGSGSALTRIPEMDAWAEIPGAFFSVEQGTTYADSMWLCTANQGGTLGSTSITFQQVNAAGLSDSNFVTNETPSGSIDGSNTTFTLANTPVTGSEMVFVNGVKQKPGSGNGYTITTNTITLTDAPLSGENVEVSYRK